MEPGNRRRIVRALEVIELTGQQFSSFGPGIDEYGPPAIDVTMYGVAFESPVLAGAHRAPVRARCARRDSWTRCGRSPADALSRTAREAIGYREVLAYLAGESQLLDDAFDAAVRRTRRFARRQRVWFGRDPRVQWVDGTATIRTRLARESLAAWSAPIALGAAAS